jgi:phosphatidylglycerophosphatase A
VPLYLLVRGGGPVAVLVVAACLALIGVWAASAVSRETGQSDPQIVASDEVAGALVAFSTAGNDVRLVALAFVAFRVFDILKIAPARYVERFPAGWRIVADDLVAGVWSSVLVGIVRAAMA